MVDLLGPMPVADELWMRSEVGRAGKQIELVGAEMLGLGPDDQPRPVAHASGWQMHQLDTGDVVHAAAPPLGPLTEARQPQLRREVGPRTTCTPLDWRWLTKPLNDGPGESWIKPTVDLVKGEAMTPLQRLFAVADNANGIGTKLDITKWTFLNTDLAVHVFRIPTANGPAFAPRRATGPTASAPPSAHCSTSMVRSAAFSSQCWCVRCRFTDPSSRQR